MKRAIGLTLILPIVLAGAAWAGSVEGKLAPGTVVYIDAIAGKTFPAPAQKPLIDQKGLKFNPSVLIVQQGATVEFQNDDSVQHNVFWPSVGGNKKDAHNLGTWPRGEKRSYKFDQPGVIPLLCNVHPEMSGYIIVSPTPYYAQADANGNFKIDNVPDGKYNLVVWHEGAKPSTKSVTVAGNVAANVTAGK
jgi:plastocyanin